MKIRSYLDQIMITKKILTVDDRYFVQKLIALGWSDWRTPDENMISLYCYLLCALIKEKSSINLFSINLFFKKKGTFWPIFHFNAFLYIFYRTLYFFQSQPVPSANKAYGSITRCRILASGHPNTKLCIASIITPTFWC